MTQPVTDNCLRCNEPLYHEFQLHFLWQFKRDLFQVLCNSCQKILENTKLDRDKYAIQCQLCHHLLDDSAEADLLTKVYDYQDLKICHDCQFWLKIYSLDTLRNEVIFAYEPIIRETIHAFKSNGDILKGYLFKHSLQKIHRSKRQYQWIVLPSSAESLQSRQFHATGLLLDIAEIPYICPFDYIGDGKKQALKNREERLLMSQPFQVNQENIKEDKLLIFDDIYTTGTTLLYAKKALTESFPNKKIKSVTLARGI